MQSRRYFLAGAVAAPAVLKAGSRAYTPGEIEKLIFTGDVKGKVTRQDLPTPALVLELDAFDRNVSRMASHLKQRGRAFRPHAKTHKCAAIGLALMKAGASGACAAKISEAEALAEGGVTNLLLTSAPVGRTKMARALRLAGKRPETIFSVDDPGHVKELNDAAAASRLKLNLAVDLYMGRTGIAAGQPALELAKLISSLKNLRLAGIQAYSGAASHTNGFENRKRFSAQAMGAAVETRRLFEQAGLACPLLTGGSTGTYNIDSEIDGITEVQPGSFMFMDVDYARIGGADGPAYRDFEHSLIVIATVISRPLPSVAIVDAGYKAFATDRPFGPEPRSLKGVTYAWNGDEHGKLDFSKAGAEIKLGERVELLVPHCDPTVNLYDRIYAVRGDSVEAVWRVTARGMTV